MSTFAAPNPTVTTADVPNEHFVGEQFCFTATFTTAPDTGYGPYFQLFLAPDFAFSSATLFGSSVNSTLVGIYPTVTTDPISGETVTGPSGSSFYTLQLPIGSVTNGGAPINTEICIDVDSNATPNVLQSNAIQLTPVFQFGDSPTGSTAITGNSVSRNITPTIIEYSETDLTAEGENPPGPIFAYDIELVADIAADKTVSSIVFPQVVLTDNRQFLGPIENVNGASCMATVTNSDGISQLGFLPFNPTHMTEPGGTIEVSCTSGTGTVGIDKDITVTIPVYPVDHLDASSCSFESTVERNISKHVVVRKSADITTIRPADEVTFTLSFEVSEFISATNVSLTDIMPNGLTYTGVETITVGGVTYNITPSVSNNNPTNGQTTVVYDLSSVVSAFPPATTGEITYTATVNELYDNTEPLRSNDSITNNVTINYDVVDEVADVIVEGIVVGQQVVVVGATNCSDTSSETLNVSPLEISKTLLNPAAEYQPGNSISFRLRLDIPSGDTQNIVFNDYFPLPALGVSGFDTNTNIAANTMISYGPNDTLALTPLSITVDIASNELSIVWPDVDSANNETIEVDIQALVISVDPFSDNLFLTNVFEQTADNTAGETSFLYDGVSFTLRAPVLEIEKDVTPTEQVDAGDTVSYSIVVTNEGGADAFETTIRDELPDGVANCSVANAPLGTGDLFGTGYILSSTIAPNASVTFTFSCIVETAIEINSTHTNTAYATWASAENAEHFPEIDASASFSTSPRELIKSVVSTSQAHTSDAGTGTTNDRLIVSIGEIIRYRLAVVLPEGTSNDVRLIDTLPLGLKYVTGSATVALISDDGITHSVVCDAGGSPQVSGSAITTPDCGVTATLPNVAAATGFVSGTNPLFDLGDLVNTDNDDDFEYIVLEFDALVLNELDRNQDARGNSNRFRVRFNGTLFDFSDRAFYRLYEPQILLTTTATAASLDTINMTVDFVNDGRATAFQVAGNDGSPLSFTLQDGLMNINNISINVNGNVYENGTTTAITAADFIVSGINNETLTLTKPLQIAPDAEITFSFDANVIPGISPAGGVTNVVVEYASQATGGAADDVRTGIDLSAGTGNDPIRDMITLNDYRVEAPLNVYEITGKVYSDVDSDGVHDPSEEGISGVTIVLYDTANNICRSIETNGLGDYSFFPVPVGTYQVIESARQTTPTSTQCPPTEEDPSGYTSTTSNTISLTVVDSSFNDQNFGDLQGLTFTPNHNDSILPGNVVFYPHILTVPENGLVQFTGVETGQTAANWSYVIYNDSNCDGTLSTAEATTPIEGFNLGIVNGDGRFCIINKVYAPTNAPAQDRHQVTITATFTYGSNSTTALTVNDVTTVSGSTPTVEASKLELIKTVENMGKSAETETLNEAIPGDFLKYRIYYRNTGTGPIKDLQINDATPAFTAFVIDSESCENSTPAGMTCNPVVAVDSSIQWDFTGSLMGGEGGHVSYEVMVSN